METKNYGASLLPAATFAAPRQLSRSAGSMGDNKSASTRTSGGGPKTSSSTIAGTKSVASTSSSIVDSILPEFVEYQEKYNRAILRGRHPRSFKMESELWSNVNKSLKRVAKVAKGRNIWNVIDEDDDHFFSGSALNTDDDDTSFGSSTRGASVATSGTRRGSQMTSNKKPNLPPKIKKHTTKINGFVVNMESKEVIQYGSRVVIQNSLGEMLCVDANDEARLKPREDIGAGDRVCFKIIDLDNYDTLGPVPLCGSSKVWIQVVDKPGDNDDHLWQYSYILGAKLFNSPAMSTVKIDPTYSSKSQQALDKAATDGSSASTASICGSVIPVRIVEIVRRAASDGSDPLSDTRDVATKFHSKRSFMFGQFTIFPGARADTSTFLSAMQPVFLGQDMYCISSSKGNPYTTWPRSASDIYFDTVDLSSMQSSSPSSRPSTAEAMGRLLGVDKRGKAKRSKVEEDSGVAVSQLPSPDNSHHNSPSGLPSPSQPSAPSPVAKHSNRTIYSGQQDGDYVCLRRIVHKGPPFEFALDRRSIFSFFQVDSNTVSMAMGDKDRAAQRVINEAKSVLSRSEHCRKGKREYTAVNLGGNADVGFSSTIYGGEGFVPGLRNVVSADILLSETVKMMPYRRKNQNIREVFRQELSQHFTEDRSDNISASLHQGSKSSRSRGKKKKSRTGFSYNSNSDNDESVSLDGSILSYQLDDSTIGSANTLSSPQHSIVPKQGTSDTASLNDNCSMGGTSYSIGMKPRRDRPKLRPMHYVKPDENALLLEAIHLNAPIEKRQSPQKRTRIHTSSTMNDLLSIPSDNDGLSAGEMMKAIRDTMSAVSFNVCHTVELEHKNKAGAKTTKNALNSTVLFGAAPSRRKSTVEDDSILCKIKLLLDEDQQMLKAASYRQRIADVEKLTRDFGDGFVLMGNS